jgi:hypothetical protein
MYTKNNKTLLRPHISKISCAPGLLVSYLTDHNKKAKSSRFLQLQIDRINLHEQVIDFWYDFSFREKL